MPSNPKILRKKSYCFAIKLLTIMQWIYSLATIFVITQ